MRGKFGKRNQVNATRQQLTELPFGEALEVVKREVLELEKSLARGGRTRGNPRALAIHIVGRKYKLKGLAEVMD